MRRSVLQYAQALDDSICGSSEREQPSVADRFLNLLRRERTVSLLSRILEQYENIIAHRDGRTILRVASSEPLTADSKCELARACAVELKAVQWQETRDTTLISGARVRFGDRVLNVSLADRIDHLKRLLV